jgi:hypothetical protein
MTAEYEPRHKKPHPCNPYADILVFLAAVAVRAWKRHIR